MYREKSLAIGVTWALLTQVSVSFGQKENVPKNDQQLAFVINGMRHERNLLRSGICEIVGEMQSKDANNPANELDGRVEILVAFDGLGNERLDRSEPGWIVDTKLNDPSQKKQGVQSVRSNKGIISAKFCRNKDNSAWWIVNQTTINIGGPESRPQNEIMRRLDVRALGLCGILEFQKGMSLDEALTMRSSGPAPTIDDSNSSQWVLTWRGESKTLVTEWRMWIDVESGFTPVRAELRNSRVGNTEWRVTQSLETKWEQRDGVRIPVEHSLVSTPNSSNRYEHKYSLQWKNINKPIDPQMFTHKAFDAPSHVGVIDGSMGRPVQLKLDQTPDEPFSLLSWFLKPVGLSLAVFFFALIVVVSLKSRLWNNSSG